MPFLMSFALEHEILTLAWIENASVQSRSTFMQLKGKLSAAVGLLLLCRLGRARRLW